MRLLTLLALLSVMCSCAGDDEQALIGELGSGDSGDAGSGDSGGDNAGGGDSGGGDSGDDSGGGDSGDDAGGDAGSGDAGAEPRRVDFGLGERPIAATLSFPLSIAGELPATLAGTGLFANTETLEPAPGLIPYGVNSPLWSDGARKLRWLALPGEERVTYSPTDDWDFPLGTAIVKHFELERPEGGFYRLETRVFFRHVEGWRGYTYRWGGREDDAPLLEGRLTEELPFADPDAPGGRKLWYYPAREECFLCHTTAAGQVLGLRTRQLNGDFAYEQPEGDMALANQIASWEHIGLFDTAAGDVEVLDRLAPPGDSDYSLTERARSYLDANCAMCHQEGGGTFLLLDLRYEARRVEMNAVDVEPQRGDIGLRGARILQPSRKEASVLWERMRRTDAFRMPLLGSLQVDSAAVELLGEWIDEEL